MLVVLLECLEDPGQFLKANELVVLLAQLVILLELSSFLYFCVCVFSETRFCVFSYLMLGLMLDDLLLVTMLVQMLLDLMMVIVLGLLLDCEFLQILLENVMVYLLVIVLVHLLVVRYHYHIYFVLHWHNYHPIEYHNNTNLLYI